MHRLTVALPEATRGWRFEPVVAALRALRGIDTVSAIGLVTEIGDIGRFSSARQLMGYLGLVPSASEQFLARVGTQPCLEGAAAALRPVRAAVFAGRAGQQGLRRRSP